MSAVDLSCFFWMPSFSAHILIALIFSAAWRVSSLSIAHLSTFFGAVAITGAGAGAGAFSVRPGGAFAGAAVTGIGAGAGPGMERTSWSGGSGSCSIATAPLMPFMTFWTSLILFWTWHALSFFFPLLTSL